MGEALHASTLEEAVGLLGDLLREIKAKRIVVNNVQPMSGLGLDCRLPDPDIEWHFVGQTDGDMRQFCAAADVGISGADAALAETGSIIISSGPGRSRLATLLPPIHIALVSISLLTTDLITWTAVRQKTISHQYQYHQRPQQNGRHRTNYGRRRTRPQTVHRYPL